MPFYPFYHCHWCRYCHHSLIPLITRCLMSMTNVLFLMTILFSFSCSMSFNIIVIFWPFKYSAIIIPTSEACPWWLTYSVSIFLSHSFNHYLFYHFDTILPDTLSPFSIINTKCLQIGDIQQYSQCQYSINTNVIY